MQASIEEKLMAFAPTVTGYYNWDQMAADMATTETAFAQGVIVCYQMIHGHRDKEELEVFNKIMEKYRY